MVLDDFVPEDHVCRVIDAFVEMLDSRSLVSNAFRPLKRDAPDTIRAIC